MENEGLTLDCVYLWTLELAPLNLQEVLLPEHCWSSGL
jgi:hypothetical protein